MRNVLLVVLLAAVALGIGIGCGGESAPQTESGSPTGFFPDKIDSLSIVRSSDVRLFVGDSLWEYINGGAELYHLYGFGDVATAYYSRGETEIVGDVYRFDSDEGCFGLYSELRPPEADPVPYGVEGFSTGASTDYVKGRYLVRLTGYDETEATVNLIADMAAIMNAAVPGTTELPATFARLPETNKVERSEFYKADSYLGHDFLKRVYGRLYAIDGDTLTFFCVEAGNILQNWRDAAGDDASDYGGSDMIGFDDSGLIVTSDYYGDILVGKRAGWLLGVIGFRQEHQAAITAWTENFR